jgi:hypothetical protein
MVKRKGGLAGGLEPGAPQHPGGRIGEGRIDQQNFEHRIRW